MAEQRPSAEEEGWKARGGQSAHRRRSQSDADRVAGEIAPYLARHAEAVVDQWLEWDGDDATLVVAFLSDAEAHQAALGPRVRVCQRPYTRAQLQAVVDEMIDFADTLEGVSATSAGAMPAEGVAVLSAVTADPDALRAALVERYGDMVRLRWLGPHTHRQRVVEVTGWSIDSDDRTLTVQWYASGGHRPGPLEIRETAEAVEVTAHSLSPVGLSTRVARPRSQTAVLAEPLGTRVIIDRPTGKTVRRGPPRLFGEE